MISEYGRFPMTKLVAVFNWHFFLLASIASLLGILGIYLIQIEWIRLLLGVGVVLAVYFMIASVIASYFVYDRSDMYQLNWWPNRVFPPNTHDTVLIHAGYDPASRKIAAKFPNMNFQILDFFDPKTTTEKSIQTARGLFPALPGEKQIRVDSLPVADKTTDVVFLLSAAHEIRHHSDRVKFFKEVGRILKPTGKVIVMEQLRDLRNFAFFGFAAFHFLSPKTWRKSFEDGNLQIVDEFRMSPWMKAFVLSNK